MGKLEDEAQRENERRSRVMAGDHSDDEAENDECAATPKGGGATSSSGVRDGMNADQPGGGTSCVS